MVVIAGEIVWRVDRLYPRIVPPMQLAYQGLAADLGRLASHDELVLSPALEIGPIPPQLLAVSRKRVYQVNNPEAAIEKIAAVSAREAYRVDLLYLVDGNCRPSPELVEGLEHRETSNLLLFRGPAHFVMQRLTEMRKVATAVCEATSSVQTGLRSP